MSLEIKDGEVRMVIDTRFYGYLAILRTAKVFTKKNWVFLDGDPFDKIIISLKPKNETASKELGYAFHNCMLDIINKAIKKFKQ